jgi:molybdenum cofactor synthesis domain-containing protein
VTPVRLAILTVSDGVSRGARADRSGDLIAEWAAARGYVVSERASAPDEVAVVEATLRAWSDGGALDLILTTGGTGFTARDLTPEATRAIIEREAPGVAEAIRQYGAAATDYAWLSRGVAGIRGRTLIVNLPGSTGGVRDGLTVLDRFLGHAVQLLRGIDTERHTRKDG